MEAEKKIGLKEIWVGVCDPRQAGKVEDDLVEMLVVAVAAVLAGADSFVDIEAWANEKLEIAQVGHRRLTAEVGASDTPSPFPLAKGS